MFWELESGGFPGAYSGFGGQGLATTVKMKENHQKPRKKHQISNNPSKSRIRGLSSLFLQWFGGQEPPKFYFER